MLLAVIVNAARFTVWLTLSLPLVKDPVGAYAAWIVCEILRWKRAGPLRALADAVPEGEVQGHPEGNAVIHKYKRTVGLQET